MPSIGKPRPPAAGGFSQAAPAAFVPRSADLLILFTKPHPIHLGFPFPARLCRARGGGFPGRAPHAAGRGCRWTTLVSALTASPPRVAGSSRGLRLGTVAGGGRSQRKTEKSEREPPPAEPRTLEPFRLRPQIRRDDPLNLSILLSGGKETNKDSLSSGERRGKSPAPNPRPTGGRGKCGVWKTASPVSAGGLSPSDRGSARGRCEAGNGPRRAGVRSSRSRVVCECSPKRVVNSI